MHVDRRLIVGTLRDAWPVLRADREHIVEGGTAHLRTHQRRLPFHVQRFTLCQLGLLLLCQRLIVEEHVARTTILLWGQRLSHDRPVGLELGTHILPQLRQVLLVIAPLRKC